MARDNFGVIPDLGWINRKFTDLQRQVEGLRSERRSEATTVSEGDFTVEGGGSVRVKGGGSIVADGGLILSLFIFFKTALQPQGITVEDTTPGSAWAADFGHLGSGVIGIRSVTQPLQLTTGTNDVRIDHTTTASAANAFLDSTTKRIYRSTSSLRYKQDVEDHDVDPADVLAMISRSWRDRAEVEADPKTERRYVGFIAEELHALGLTEFVVYDADGEPEAIAYDRLAVALLSVLKDHDARIAALETNALTKEP